MGCAVTLNNKINPKKNDNEENISNNTNNLNKKLTNSNLINNENVIENNNINYVNHPELEIEKMAEIKYKYNILEQISNNDISTDYKIQLKSNLSKYKTLKIIRKKLIGDENKISMEIKTINSLNHEKLLKIEECYYDSINYYIIMEYCKLGKLSDLIKKKRILSENQVKLIIYQLLDVESYLLENDLIHTDINPNNILIESCFKYNNEELYLIKLLNFASSTYMKSINVSENNSNNLPFYVSPEIFDNQYNLNSDIWSIGVIMYEMLFGVKLFFGNNYNEVINNIKNKNLDFDIEKLKNEFNIIDLSEDAIYLLKNMLLREIESRFDAKRCLEHPWFVSLKEFDDLDEDINTDSNKKNSYDGTYNNYNNLYNENNDSSFKSSQIDDEKNVIVINNDNEVNKKKNKGVTGVNIKFKYENIKSERSNRTYSYRNEDYNKEKEKKMNLLI